jgi:ribosomal protein S3AE
VEISAEVRDIVANMVTERFPDATILSIETTGDVDTDDDEIMKVKVVFATETERLDARATSSFLRYLRPKLSEVGVSTFPVMSFLSGNDTNGVAA